MQNQQLHIVFKIDQLNQVQLFGGESSIEIQKQKTKEYSPELIKTQIGDQMRLNTGISCFKLLTPIENLRLPDSENISQLESQSQKQYLSQSKDRQMSQVFPNLYQKPPSIDYSDSQSPINLNQIEADEKKLSEDVSTSTHYQSQCDDQTLQKKNENKQKYRRIRQKLTSMSYQHQQPSLMSDLKEVTSPNKSRILRLAIQLQKLTQTQNREYGSIESVLREIQKILQHRREHDLLVLRQSKFIPTVSIIFKSIPALHKNQLLHSLKTLWMSLRILRYLSSLGSNRNYLILTNQLTILNTLLSCLLGKEQRKVGLECLTVLNQILGSSISSEAQPIVSMTLQLSFCSQLLKKIKVNLESCIGQEGLSDEEFMLSSLNYLFNVLKRYFQGQIDQPVDEIYQTPQQGQIDSLASFLLQFLTDILYERDGKDGMVLREQEPPTCVVNICLYILKILNIIFHVSLASSQKIFQNLANQNLTNSMNYLLSYSKQNLTGSQQLRSVCNEMMILIGNCCLNNKSNQNLIRKTKLLEKLHNFNFSFLMDPILKDVLVPSLCCVIYDSKENIREAFKQNSSITVVNYLQKEASNLHSEYESQKNGLHQNLNRNNFQKNKSLSRNDSTSSLTSSKSYTTQQSHNVVIGNIVKIVKKYKGSQLRFPQKYWKYLEEQLNQADCS